MRKTVVLASLMFAVGILGIIIPDILRLRLVLVSPGDGAGATLLVQAMPDLMPIDSLNSYCLRSTNAVTERCRQTFLSEVASDGATLFRLPYLPWLDQQSSLPPQVEH